MISSAYRVLTYLFTGFTQLLYDQNLQVVLSKAKESASQHVKDKYVDCCSIR